MRTRILTAALAVLLLPAGGLAQQTLLGEGIESGGYGGPGFRLTGLNGELAIQAGGQGAWVVGKRYAIGGAGYGIASNHEIDDTGTVYEVSFGYGGLLLEYLRDPDTMLHWYGSLLIGGGGVSLRDPSLASDVDDVADDVVLVVEPAVHLGLNVAKTFRIGLGAGWRLVTGLRSGWESAYGLSAADLGSPFLSLTFRFGRY
jgi:hypothetical protein